MLFFKRIVPIFGRNPRSPPNPSVASSASKSKSNSKVLCIVCLVGIYFTFEMSDLRAPILLPPEAERLVESIRPIKLEDIGGKEWSRQHQNLEKLNMQVACSAQLSQVQVN